MAAVTIRKEIRDDLQSLNVDQIVRGCLFDIPSDELASYLEREHRYIPVQLEVTDEEVLLQLVYTNTNPDQIQPASADSILYIERSGHN